MAETSGLNEGVFDVSIPVSRQLTRIHDEDEQVQHLLAQKGAFSASALWNVCGMRVGNARVAVRAQKKQIALNNAKHSKQSPGRLDRQAKLLRNAQVALEKHKTSGVDNNSLSEKDCEDIVRWVLPEVSVHISTCPTLCYCLLRTVDYHPLSYGYRHDADTPISLV